MSSQNHKSPKEAQNADGFDIFNCHIPQAVVGFCKKFIKRNPAWNQEVISETEDESANLISHNRGENLVNLDGFTGPDLASVLESVLENNLKWGEISLGDVMGQSVLLEKLKNAVGVKTKKRFAKPTQPSISSTPKKRTRSVSSDYEDSDNETVIGQDCEGAESDLESEYGNEENEGVDNTLANESAVSMPEHPLTPGYTKTPKRQKRSSKPEMEKKTSISDGSDSDSFDPVVDDEFTGYNPLGEIIPHTTRIVIRGANKNYYGM